MSNPAKAEVVMTRWWWVRHAPVRSDGGNIYGQTDIACDTGDREVFEAVAKILPRRAVWYASNLQRTHQTAEAIWATGFPRPAAMIHIPAFAEQNLGQWQGMNRAAFLASRPVGRSLSATRIGDTFAFANRSRWASRSAAPTLATKRVSTPIAASQSA